MQPVCDRERDRERNRDHEPCIHRATLCAARTTDGYSFRNRSRSCGAEKSSSGPTGTMPVGLMLRWLP